MADIFEAITAGDRQTVRELLTADPAAARARNGDGVSAVLWACYVQQVDLANEIARAAETLDVFEAAALNETDRLDELLRADPSSANAMSPDGFPALGLATFFGAGDAAKTLLAAGADPNQEAASNAMRVAPLHSAAAAHRADLIRLLLDAGADPNARQQEGWTALHEAAHNGDEEMAEALLVAGADPAATSEDGTTPAALAAGAGHTSLAERLTPRRS